MRRNARWKLAALAAVAAAAMLLAGVAAPAQTQKAPTQKAPRAKKAPASPPREARIEVAGKVISIQYSAPSVRGRTNLFGPGGLISHDANYPVWRAGANSATSLHTGADLTLGSLQVPKGDYTLYVSLADPEHWVLIVNKETGQWGLTYKKSSDLGRVPMQMSTPAQPVEQLRYGLSPHALTLEWDGHRATVPLAVH